MADSRPKWPYSMRAKTFHILCHGITNMRIVYDYSDYDNVKTHMFYLCGVQEGVKHIEVKNPVGFQEMFEFSPDWNKLFQLTAKGEQALKLSEEIKKWDSNNKSERTTYERLKLKFGDSQ